MPLILSAWLLDIYLYLFTFAKENFINIIDNSARHEHCVVGIQPKLLHFEACSDHER